ncbi:MAG: VOC family protein [Anaerolineae bacterium]|jgi:PhnB protein|nr:VOC family protein [Anaerolineae bacterium]
MPINPYLNFDGDTREAVEFYARVFDTEPQQTQTYGELPEDPSHPLPEAARNRIMHTRIYIDGTPLMFSDTFPGMPFTPGNNFTLTLTGADRGQLERRFHALAEGGAIIMPLQETFWTKLYGQVRDKFGIEWQVNLEE